ncbi:hypothetical protein [Oryza sativa Japonica Group]|uniref:Uncharacterized protein n=1 Tax=Oryza sativa subsp. japonica TaxID=39947 RepID=Q8RZL5_ORYSJ|nr:hypothetical protein [Oryza sativa Japonica Group]
MEAKKPVGGSQVNREGEIISRRKHNHPLATAEMSGSMKQSCCRCFTWRRVDVVVQLVQTEIFVEVECLFRSKDEDNDSWS